MRSSPPTAVPIVLRAPVRRRGLVPAKPSHWHWPYMSLPPMPSNTELYPCPRARLKSPGSFDPSKQALTLRWRERGGPRVETPSKNGFGTRLLRSTFAGDGERAVADFAWEGVTWTLELSHVEPA